jgi:hypothetical protein
MLTEFRRLDRKKVDTSSLPERQLFCSPLHWPGVGDNPQHINQGAEALAITLVLLCTRDAHVGRKVSVSKEAYAGSHGVHDLGETDDV